MSEIVDDPLIQARYFFPRPDTFTAGEDPALGARVSVSVPGARLDCYHHAPWPDAPLLVHFHGNGEVVADYTEDLAPALVARGLNVFFAEYRGYGASTGTPALGRMLEDVPALVQATGVPPARIVFMGRSIGSIYAIHAVSLFPEAAGLIIESGVASPLERVLLRVSPRELGVSIADMRAAFAERLDHQRKLSAWTGPTLLLHARHDHIVPLDDAEHNRAWAGGTSELEIFDAGDHNTIILCNQEAYLDRIQAFARGLG